MEIRNYDRERDRDAVFRIWREVGWYKEGHDEILDLVIDAGNALVAEIEGAAECLTLSAPGTLRYLDETLPLSAVTSVSTSLVARRQGLARRVTARLLARDALDGAAVAGLGIFDQGFYNQLGFGNGSYTIQFAFDPAQIQVPGGHRVPRRLGHDDWETVHRGRMARVPAHGQVTLTPPIITRADMGWGDTSFGLGYMDGPNGELSHHVWIGTDAIEHGPYNVNWISYRTREQFRELLSLLGSLGDQVRLVRMDEPAGIQLQDLLRQPFRQYAITEGARHAARARALAWWQMRILNLNACLASTHLSGEPVRFCLELEDPISRFLDADERWSGIAGEYVVTLGEESSARRGTEAGLPTLRATVNAFTRLWLGVRPASGLAITDQLDGPPDLLARLDRLLRLPVPCPDWDY
jgi:hypothetical protein